MAVSLGALTIRLQSLAPAQDGAPSESGYVQCVKDAVLQLAQDAPRRVTAELSVLSGTAQYLMPADFLFLIGWPALNAGGGVMIDARGIIPLPDGGWRERVAVSDGVLTIYPPPVYTMPRTYRYAGAHVLTGAPGAEVYATLNENSARVALLYACYLVFTQQAQAKAGQAWRYQIGDEMVDKSKVADVGMAVANAALQSYKLALGAVKSWA